MTTTSLIASRSIGLAINSIDAIAAAADPVYRAGQRAGRHCKPLLASAWAQIDWHEVARITLLGLVISAIAIWRFLRWCQPALVRLSAHLGRWYATRLVDHEAPSGDPQPAEEPSAPPPAAIDLITPPAAPEPAAATPAPEPPATPVRKAARRARRSRRSKAPAA